MSDTAAVAKRMTRVETLGWIKRVLAEMSECHLEPQFITMGTELTPRMFEFLYDQVRMLRIPMRKMHMEHHPGDKQHACDTIRDFVAQLDTLD